MATAEAPIYTVQDLLEKAQENIDALQYDVAHKFCLRALEQDGAHAEALEQTAAVELELGLFRIALQRLNRCVELFPDTGYSKYMYLGQMAEGKDAIAHFQKGARILRTALQASDLDAAQRATLSTQLAAALCSMAEIYLTDCCFEPEAEASCEQLLEEAVAVDPQSPEVYQLMASVRLSQQRIDEGRTMLLSGLALWQNQDPSDARYPSYDARIATTKLLLELELFDEALHVLSALQKEDDQTVDLWYLYGWTYYCLGEDAKQTISTAKNDVEPEERVAEHRAHIRDAAECLTTAISIHQQVGHDDGGILAHAQELLETIGRDFSLDTLLAEAQKVDDDSGKGQALLDAIDSGDEAQMITE
ncbi:hypothetical protein H4R35_003011 [Dimargaris xerosporica]|nr:hypothetical protein H4R35_003011 [Dimargaris xerosporica]